jgi:hypothetical protein
MVVFWVVTPCGIIGGTNISDNHTASIISSEDGGSMFLRNFDKAIGSPHIVITEKTATNIFTIIRTSDLI